MNKNALIESGAYQDIVSMKKELFLLNKKINTYDISLYPYPEEITREALRIYDNKKKRTQRMYNKILSWTFALQNQPSYKNYYVIFATLTFTDEQLEKTSRETRRQYVFRFLKGVSEHYIANIDFGKENGREHYHALLFVKEKLNPTEWKKGFSFYEEVNLSFTNFIKCTKYINKLTNHSFKETNTQERVIYDRNNDLMLKVQKLICPEEVRKYKIQHKQSYQ